MVDVGPAAADVDGAGVALVLLRQPALAAVVYARIVAHVSLVLVGVGPAVAGVDCADDALVPLESYLSGRCGTTWN